MSGYNSIKRSEKRVIEEAFGMADGYPLDFSNRTIEEFFEDEFNIDFYDSKYDFNGTSKAKTLRAVLETEPSGVVGTILRKLWDYRSTLPKSYRMDDPDQEDALRVKFFSLVGKIEGNVKILNTDAISSFESSRTLDELVTAIERDIRADKAEAALDRLHTYCMKRFRHLIELEGGAVSENDPLHSRVGRYAKLMGERDGISEISLAILKSSISVFEKFNHVRNNESFAHDNELIQRNEARFIFDSISSVLRFLKSQEDTHNA